MQSKKPQHPPVTRIAGAHPLYWLALGVVLAVAVLS